MAVPTGPLPESTVRFDHASQELLGVVGVSVEVLSEQDVVEINVELGLGVSREDAEVLRAVEELLLGQTGVREQRRNPDLSCEAVGPKEALEAVAIRRHLGAGVVDVVGEDPARLTIQLVDGPLVLPLVDEAVEVPVLDLDGDGPDVLAHDHEVRLLLAEPLDLPVEGDVDAELAVQGVSRGEILEEGEHGLLSLVAGRLGLEDSAAHGRGLDG